jgi:hypothetical protein
MTKLIKSKIEKLWRKLLKAEARHKERKAAKLEYKILQETLAERKK